MQLIRQLGKVQSKLATAEQHEEWSQSETSLVPRLPQVSAAVVSPARVPITNVDFILQYVPAPADQQTALQLIALLRKKASEGVALCGRLIAPEKVEAVAGRWAQARAALLPGIG